nr:MAG TPA: hypothetical protein [Bacteriophage sp.]
MLHCCCGGINSTVWRRAVRGGRGENRTNVKIFKKFMKKCCN